MELNTTGHKMINTILKPLTKFSAAMQQLRESFLCQHDFKNLVKEITSFKSTLMQI